MGGLGAAAAVAGCQPKVVWSRLVNDTLVICQTGDIVSLDPAFRLDTLTGNVQKHLYSTMLERRRDMRVGPGVAAKVERAGPTRWNVTLGEELFFSNGEPVDAEAAQFTIARINADETRSPLRSLFSTIRKVTVASPRLLTIETKGPDALFEARMTNLQLVPPKYGAKVGAGFNAAPVGSGRYVLEHWRKNEEILLTANPHYRGPIKPRFRHVIFRPVPEQIARISAIKTGAANIVTSLSASQAAGLVKGQQVQVLKVESNRVMVVQFNKLAAPANNPEFRRAIGLAIDRDQLIRGLMKGYADPVRTIFASSITGIPDGAVGDFPYDPAQARAIIEKLGLKGSAIEVAGAAGRYPFDREIALVVGAQLRRVGLNAVVRTEEYGAFANAIKNNTVAPVFLQPHGNVWLDPLPQIMAFTYSKGHWSGWRDPSLDQIIDKANVAEGDNRLELIGDIIAKMRDEAICVPLFAYQEIYGATPALQWTPRADDLIIAEEVA